MLLFGIKILNCSAITGQHWVYNWCIYFSTQIIINFAN